MQSNSTQKALQKQHFDFNSIWRNSLLIYQKVSFIQINIFTIYNVTLGTSATHLGVKLWQLPCRGIFGIFCNFPLFMTSQVSKISQKWPCTVTVIAQRPDELQRFPLCHCKDKWQSYIFLYYALSDKCAHCSAICCWSQQFGFGLKFQEMPITVKTRICHKDHVHIFLSKGCSSKNRVKNIAWSLFLVFGNPNIKDYSSYTAKSYSKTNIPWNIQNWQGV